MTNYSKMPGSGSSPAVTQVKGPGMNQGMIHPGRISSPTNYSKNAGSLAKPRSSAPKVVNATYGAPYGSYLTDPQFDPTKQDNGSGSARPRPRAKANVF